MAVHTHLRTYAVVLSSGTEYVLAPNAEAAAWQALELSVDRNVQLIDVRQHVDFEW